MMMGGGCGAIPVLVLMADPKQQLAASRLLMPHLRIADLRAENPEPCALQDASMLHRLLFMFYILLFGLVSLEVGLVH